MKIPDERLQSAIIVLSHMAKPSEGWGRFPMRIASAALIGILLSCVTSATAQVATPERLAAAERIFDAEAAKNTVGSMTIAVVADGKTVLLKSYGFRDTERQVPATPDTIYRIGSITKQFTALALLNLEAEGPLRLSDEASDYVPSLRTNGTADLLSLATHRAGLAREPDDAANYWSGKTDRWQEIARDALEHTQALYPVGERVSYSNIGYAALGLAIQKASSRSYIAYVQDQVLDPLGMKSTAFTLNPEMVGRLAKAQGPDAVRAAAELSNGRGYRIPNGGLFTTAPDMAGFLAFEMGVIRHPRLDAAILARNTGPTFPGENGTRYGVGFFTESHGDRTLVGHNGGVAGYAASAFYDPDSKVGIVCLASTQVVCRQRFFDVYAVFVPGWVPVANQARASVKTTP